MPNHRKDELADILVEYLDDVSVQKSNFSDNPTMNEILASGRNVIIEMEDSYIEAKNDLFWPMFVHNLYTGRSNPEDLFETLSQILAEIKNNYDDRITLVSAVQLQMYILLLAPCSECTEMILSLGPFLTYCYLV